jgi:hypothetical protein
MSEDRTDHKQIQPKVTIEDVNRVLEVGRLLLSVLTPEEIEELQALLIGEPFTAPDIGNTGVT